MGGCADTPSFFVMSDKAYLQRLIKEGEHQQQDFKYKITDACKLAKSVSAFANTKGGRLLIGVRDDGHLSGVRSEEEIFMMRSAATDYCRPAVDLSFQTFLTEGRSVVVATVTASDHKPINALGEDGRWRAYIRIADENIVASPVHLRIWLDEQSAKGHLISIGEEEEQVMACLSKTAGLPLRQVVKMSGVNHRHVVVILARLIRYGLAECLFDGNSFLFHEKNMT